MQQSVFVLEPQAIFIPELSRIVTRAGGTVTRSSQFLDLEEIASLRVDYAILDLDYTMYGILDGLAFFQGLAAGVSIVLLTDERDFNRLASFHHAGAIAVLSKSMTASELQTALISIFEDDARYAPAKIAM